MHMISQSLRKNYIKNKNIIYRPNEKKTLCFDLDNTICNTKKNNYTKSKPKEDVIKLINSLYDEVIYKDFNCKIYGKNQRRFS